MPDYLDNSNENDYILEKFRVFDKIEPEGKNPYFRKDDNDLDVVLYYIYWNNKNFAKYMYYSILSYLLFTDATRVDIKVFVTNEDYRYLKDLIGGLYDGLEFITYQEVEHFYNKPNNYMSQKIGNKYRFFGHDELKGYDMAVMSDCDLIAYGENTNLFEDLLNIHYNQYSDHIIDEDFSDGIITFDSLKTYTEDTWTSIDSFSEMLKKRVKNTARFFKNFEEYLAFIKARLELGDEGLDDYLTQDRWPLTGFLSYKPDRYFDGKFWYDYVQACSDMNINDDEVVVNDYCYKEDIDFYDIETTYDDINIEIAHLNYIEGNIKDIKINDNKTNFIHPILDDGDHSEEQIEYNITKLADFFKYIEGLVEDKEPNNKPKRGNFELITGPVFSGKTTELFRRLRLARVKDDITVLATHYSRTETEDYHRRTPKLSGLGHPFLGFKNIEGVLNRAEEMDYPEVIFIDEIQGFTCAGQDVMPVVERLIDNGCRVVAAGTDRDIKGNIRDAFKVMKREADYLTEIKAVCPKCFRPAGYTQIFVDGEVVFDISDTLKELGGFSSDRIEQKSRCEACFITPSEE